MLKFWRILAARSRGLPSQHAACTHIMETHCGLLATNLIPCASLGFHPWKIAACSHSVCKRFSTDVDGTAKAQSGESGSPAQRCSEVASSGSVDDLDKAQLCGPRAQLNEGSTASLVEVLLLQACLKNERVLCHLVRKPNLRRGSDAQRDAHAIECAAIALHCS